MSDSVVSGRWLDEIGTWVHDRELHRRWVRDGLRLWLIAAGASFAVALAIVITLASQAQPSTGTAVQTPGVSGTGTPDLLVFLWSLVYFSAHLVPFDFSLPAAQLVNLVLAALARTSAVAPGTAFAGDTVSVTGIGSMTLTLLLCWLAARTGARLERDRPATGGAAIAALRAAGIGAPYAAGNLVLFVVGRWHVSAGSVSMDAAPAPAGLVVPVVLIAAAAGVGAVVRRQGRAGIEASIVRGATHAVFGLAVGIVATLALLVLALLAIAAGQPRPGTSQAGGGSSSAAVPGAMVVLGIVGLLLYAPNAIAYVWADNLGLGLLHVGPLGPVIVLGALAGAVAGASCVRPVADSVEQLAFVATFALASMLLAVASEPAVSGLTTAPAPGSIFVLAAVMATAGLAAARWTFAGRLGERVRAWPVVARYARATDAAPAPAPGPETAS